MYLALTFTPDVDWTAPEQAELRQEYRAFGREADAAGVVRASGLLHPTSTATTVVVRGGRGGDVVTSDGPYAETKEVLAGYYLMECADLDEAVRWASRIPAAWGGAVEVRPVIAAR
jgi:hypothetical protein